MEPQEIVDMALDAAERQVNLNKKVIDNHLSAAAQIQAAKASDAMVKAALALATDPPSQQ